MDFGLGVIAGVVGLGHKSVSKQDITNTIQSEIDNVNRQVMNVINEVMTSVATTVINNQETSINNRNDSGSISTIKNINVTNGGTLDINQQSKLVSKANAILSITQDATLLNKMTQDIVNAASSKISQNTQLTDNLKAVNALEKSKEVDGEVNSLIDKTAEVIKSGMDLGRDKIDETSINNSITNTIKNSTYFETNFKNVINNIVNTTISSNVMSHCLSASSSFNSFDITSINVEGAGSSVHLTQEALLDNFFGCYITSLVKTGVYQELAQSMYNKGEQEVDTSNKVADTMDVKNSIKDIEKTTSIITELLQMLMYLIVGVIIFVVVIIVAFPGLKFLKNPLSNFLNRIKKPALVKDLGTGVAATVGKIATASPARVMGKLGKF